MRAALLLWLASALVIYANACTRLWSALRQRTAREAPGKFDHLRPWLFRQVLRMALPSSWPEWRIFLLGPLGVLIVLMTRPPRDRGRP